MQPPAPIVTGHPDGFCVRFDHVVVVTAPTISGANAARHLANEALEQLHQTLSRRPSADQGA